MPFTLAHPAAAVPLLRPLGRLGVLSALVAGSMTPDLAYFLPLGVTGRQSHSAAGLLWFCLPVGLAVYLVFHLLLKRPLLSLVPAGLAGRLWALPSARRGLPAAPWAAVVVSVLAGAATHVAWDLVTHAPAAGIPPLVRRVAAAGDYPVQQFYAVLQHGSTVWGLVALAAWTRRWACAAPTAAPAPVLVPAAARAIVLAAMLLTLGMAAGAAAAPVAAWPSPGGLQRMAGRAAIAGLSALGVAVLAWSVAWHASRRARRAG